MFDLSTPMLIALIVAVVAVIAGIVLLVLASKRKKRRRERLSRRFGSEYERTVEQASKRHEAEEDLEQREQRHEAITLKPLTSAQIDAFRARFEDLQASFVDAPASAVRAADGLVTEVAVARGYPDSSTGRLLSDVSVDHPEEVAIHRRGQDQLAADAKREPSTEDLRAGLLAARQLFEVLLGQTAATGPSATASVPTEASSTRPVTADGHRGDGAEEAQPPPPEPAPTAATAPPPNDDRHPLV